MIYTSYSQQVNEKHLLYSQLTFCLFFLAGAQCQLRGRPLCAGIPVQGSRRDGPRDGASATRPHAAVRRQGEHRALYGTLPLNHAHSLCLSDTLSPSSTFIQTVFKGGTNSMASVCSSWCLFCLFFVVESQ